MDFTLVLALAIAVERFTEVIKPAIASFKLSDEAYAAVLKLIGILTGIVLALVSNTSVNLLSGYPLVPPLLGVIITGAIAGGGSAIVHAAIDLFYGWRDNTEAKAAEHAASAVSIASK